MVVVGGKKKGGKKPKKEKDVVTVEVFNIDFTVINKFAFLKVSPPLAPIELDAKINELTKKREVYLKEGEEKLALEEDRLKDMDINNY
jgi:hypothetical protein